jgi:hypothetical protein
MNHKEITQSEQHENIRKKLWSDVYVAYVAASNSIEKDGAHKWADIALKRFDERFNEPKQSHE